MRPSTLSLKLATSTSGWLPAPVFYRDVWVPAEYGGCARGPAAFLREKYLNDEGLARFLEDRSYGMVEGRYPAPAPFQPGIRHPR